VTSELLVTYWQLKRAKGRELTGALPGEYMWATSGQVVLNLGRFGHNAQKGVIATCPQGYFLVGGFCDSSNPDVVVYGQRFRTSDGTPGMLGVPIDPSLSSNSKKRPIRLECCYSRIGRVDNSIGTTMAVASCRKFWVSVTFTRTTVPVSSIY